MSSSLELQLLRTGESILLVWRNGLAEVLQHLNAECTVHLLAAIAAGVRIGIVKPSNE